MGSMRTSHAVAIATGMLALIAAGVFAAILVMGLAAIHDTGSNILTPAFSEDVACGSALRPADTTGLDSHCDSLIASRRGWVKPGLWVSGLAFCALAAATRVAAAGDREPTIKKYGRNRATTGGWRS